MSNYEVEIDVYTPPQKENEFRELITALIEQKGESNPDPRANVTVPADDEKSVKRKIREAAQERGLSARVVGEEEVPPKKKGDPAHLRIQFVLRPPITRKRDTESVAE